MAGWIDLQKRGLASEMIGWLGTHPCDLLYYKISFLLSFIVLTDSFYNGSHKWLGFHFSGLVFDFLSNFTASSEINPLFSFSLGEAGSFNFWVICLPIYTRDSRAASSNSRCSSTCSYSRRFFIISKSLSNLSTHSYRQRLGSFQA